MSEHLPCSPVDWSEVGRQNKDNPKYCHPAIFPDDSVLKHFVDAGRELTEGAECYLIGSILPVVASLLDRSVFIQWGAGKIYPNLFSMLVGKPGDRKSSTIKLASRIAWECLPANAFLPHNVSPESMFDQYCEHPDKFLCVDDANPILADWRSGGNGERVASRFLPLYDCAPMTESFMRNKSETTSARREVAETSTNILFGATFNTAAFQKQQARDGLARRFLYYVADRHGRLIVRPEKMDLPELLELFKPLLRLEGEIDFSEAAFTLWKKAQLENREQLDKVGIDDEALSSRLSSEPTHFLKIAMLFEACRCVFAGRNIHEISERSLELSIAHVAENMRSASFLESIANRSAIAAQAESVLAIIRAKIHADPKYPDTIYATKSQLTYELCRNGTRPGAMTTDDLYRQIIPHLEAQGLAKMVHKAGKLVVFAFPIEPPALNIF